MKSPTQRHLPAAAPAFVLDFGLALSLPVRALCPRLGSKCGGLRSPGPNVPFLVPSPCHGLPLCIHLPGGVPGLLVLQQRGKACIPAMPRRLLNLFEKGSGFGARSQVLPPQTQNESKATPITRLLPLNSRPQGVGQHSSQQNANSLLG